ncbi:c-type cytochrome [Deinococcus arenicola]|uniref:C-type cytochrome n=1 Tax=Deinococcus arenicola TaxID=2994950 RepID=A0ABU4DRU5_9DEIO|nr:c-type cytochrome [Deinococcus sp. ZS9-10]MDV6375151.1 c-type cytochrome [Deinococcus sp. ZS9-10]
MKNTFAVTMTLLLALTLAGGVAGYRIATTPHEEKKAETAVVPSEAAPSANVAATGAAGAPGAQGDVTTDEAGGTTSGPNGAVAQPGGEMSGEGAPTGNSEQAQAGTPTDPDTASNQQAATGNAPAATAVAAETQGDASAGQELYAGNCAGCHGADGGGGIGANLKLANGPKSWTEAQFHTVLREGKLPDGKELNATMPRFADTQITDSDIANIFAYVKTF